MRGPVQLTAAAVLILFAVACQAQPDRPAPGAQQDAPAVPAPPDEPAAPAQPDEPAASPPLSDPATSPDPDIFLPPLAGYRTDDDVDVGEIRSSLDGAVPYAGIRRRLILDEQGFTSGDVMVVTFEPGTDGAERFLRHWFGDVAREPVEIAGVVMHRIPTAAHDVIAWIGPNHVVVFGRGQAMTDQWLEDLAHATVTAIRPASNQSPAQS